MMTAFSSTTSTAHQDADSCGTVMDRFGSWAALWMRFAGIVMVAGRLSAASPDAALRSYQKGDYKASRQEYEALARSTPDDPRYRFNAGAAAYRQLDFTNAASHFESAIASRDLHLQEQAYYNLGNTLYQMGSRAPDSQTKLQQWEQALTHFNSALKLEAADTNAAANLQYVKSRVEELRKQQPPQQQQQKKDSKDSKDSKDQQDQKPNPSGGKDQKSNDKKQSGQKGPEEKDAQGANDPKDSKDGAAKDEQAQSKPNPKDAAAGKDKDSGGDSKNGSQAGRQGDPKNGKGQAAGIEDGKAGEMSAAQAARLLDEQKGDEKALVFQPGGQGQKPRDPAQRSRKTW